jgi:hypothetical protein
VGRYAIWGSKQGAVQENGPQVNLYAEIPDGLEAAIHQQALVQETRRRLNEVGPKAPGEAHGIIRGVGGNANPLEETLIAHLTKAVPHGRAEGRKEVAGGLDHDGVGALQAQTRQGGLGLELDNVGALIAPGGADGDAQIARARHNSPNNRLAVGRSGARIQNAKT